MNHLPPHPRVWVSVLIAAVILPAASSAQWTENGVPVCRAAGEQGAATWVPQAIAAGDGGVIVAWLDERDALPSGNAIYAQKVDSSGAAVWLADGVLIRPATAYSNSLRLASDGQGGAIIAWDDSRNGFEDYDVFAQRVDASGAVLWTAEGVPVCAATLDQTGPTIVFDDSGGAIVAWHDKRGGTRDIYAQRLDADGIPLWTGDGVALCTATGDQEWPRITSDAAGGATLVWLDKRSSVNDIYAQRIDSSGDVQWSADGVAVCTTGEPHNLCIVPDLAGGAIIAWEDNRSGDWDIYAQRVDSEGDMQWTADGVAVCVAPGHQQYPQVAPHGAGGVFIAWQDYGTSPGSAVYAQRIDADGNAAWQANGVPVCSAGGSQVGPGVTSDGAGGAIITWADYRSGESYVFAQSLDSNGSALWTADGVAVCTETESDCYALSIVSDGSAGAIITWKDNRNFEETDVDIYAQRVDDEGNAPPVTETVCGDHIWAQSPCEFCGQDAYFATGWTDMNHDCWVDLLDIALFAPMFLNPTVYNPSGDYQGDGWVDVVDLFRLVQSYHDQGPVEPCEPCLVLPDSCAGRIRVSFSPDPNEDLDRIDLEPFVTNWLWIVAEGCPRAELAQWSLVIEETVSIEEVLDSSVFYTEFGVSALPTPSDGTPYVVVCIRFHLTEAGPATVRLASCAGRTLEWVQHSPLRHMGYRVVSFGGVNRDPPPDSLACGAAGVVDRDGSRLYPFSITCRPNPSTGVVSIQLNPVERVAGEVEVFDSRGRLVRRLYQGALSPGQGLLWDSRSDAGQQMPPGVYFVRFKGVQLAGAGRAIVVR